MPDQLISIVDAFLTQYVMDQDFFADPATLERALEDSSGGGDYLPLTYTRTLTDPEDPTRLLVCFGYGTDTLDHELQAPARVEQCMGALRAAHPQLAAASIRLDVSGF